jgi:hypothetical protein
MCDKYIEANIPEHLHLHVVYLHEGRLSKNKLKAIGQTKTKYVTLARLKDSDGHIVAQGKAACSSKDNPSRRVGRAVAIGRALQEYYAS